jgi:hypothetical protein
VFVTPGNACGVAIHGGGVVKALRDHVITGDIQRGDVATWKQVFANGHGDYLGAAMGCEKDNGRCILLGSGSWVIPGSLLPARQVYTLRLEGHGGWSEVSVWTRGAPLGGSLSVVPGSGYGGVTEFELAARDWQDEPEALPLHYTYAYVTDDNTHIPLAQPTSRQWLSPVYLPYSRDAKTAAVSVTVCGSSGTCADATVAQVQLLTVSDHDDTATAAAAAGLSQELLRRAHSLRSSEALLQASVSVCGTIEKAEASDEVLLLLQLRLQEGLIDRGAALSILEMCTVSGGAPKLSLTGAMLAGE